MIRQFLLFLFVVSTGISLRAQSADSLAYTERKQRLAADLSEEQQLIVEAAEELATEGLFAEAHQMLEGLPAVDSTKAAASTEQKRPDSPGMVLDVSLTPVTYVRRDDIVDTSGMKQEEKDSLRDLLETPPLSSSARAQLTWKPPVAHLRHVRPRVLATSTHGRAGADAHLELFGNALTLEPKINAEKRWSMDGEYQHELLKLVQRGFSDQGSSASDNLELDFRATASTPRAGRPLGIAFPARVSAKSYREPNNVYDSYRWYRLAPEIRYRTPALTFESALRGRFEYKNYRHHRDSLSYLLIGPELETALWLPRVPANVNVFVDNRRYPDRWGLPSSLTAESEMGMHVRGLNRLTPHLTVRHIYEQEEHRVEHIMFGLFDNDTSTLSYTLAGWDLVAEPRAELDLSRDLRTDLSLIYGYREGPLTRKGANPDTVVGLEQPLYLWEGFHAVEPGISLEYSGRKGRIAASMGYRYENIDSMYARLDRPDTSETAGANVRDSRMFRVSVDASWRIAPGLTLFGYAYYHRRVYAPFNEQAAASSNLTASLSLNATRPRHHREPE